MREKKPVIDALALACATSLWPLMGLRPITRAEGPASRRGTASQTRSAPRQPAQLGPRSTSAEIPRPRARVALARLGRGRIAIPARAPAPVPPTEPSTAAARRTAASHRDTLRRKACMGA